MCPGKTVSYFGISRGENMRHAKAVPGNGNSTGIDLRVELNLNCKKQKNREPFFHTEKYILFWKVRCYLTVIFSARSCFTDMVIVVPFPASDAMSRFPPSIAALSFIPNRPRVFLCVCEISNPFPLSLMERIISLFI